MNACWEVLCEMKAPIIFDRSQSWDFFHLSLKESHLLIHLWRKAEHVLPSSFWHTKQHTLLAVFSLRLEDRRCGFCHPPSCNARELKPTTSCNWSTLSRSKNGLTSCHHEEHLRCSDRNTGGKSFSMISDKPIPPPMSWRFVREPIRLRDVTSGLANRQWKMRIFEKCNLK